MTDKTIAMMTAEDVVQDVLDSVLGDCYVPNESIQEAAKLIRAYADQQIQKVLESPSLRQAVEDLYKMQSRVPKKWSKD